MSKHHEHHKDKECEGNCEEGTCECGGGSCECEGKDCGCGGHGCECGCHFQRRYQTKEEQIEDLEKYLKDLKLEVQAVEERLSDLRK
jgi:hypothetical protein